ncbi:carboxypeptidase regulatory-like domain-containing protein [Cellulosimicrobium protaetiae]|uniref:alpha-amylase n=1 Tax=Cellulosimicrobium protaetiae TaxID=2587808 RepID=A0A6M5UEH5_9MICO|nr:carboxypeptidase regulatory-like domain-containing protein [Cellulosimicrobium protaetiae]QJW35731.1 hypothetical protein FIC82_005465 [Cellulosimicrobium protaetiae]
MEASRARPRRSPRRAWAATIAAALSFSLLGGVPAQAGTTGTGSPSTITAAASVPVEVPSPSEGAVRHETTARARAVAEVPAPTGAGTSAEGSSSLAVTSVLVTGTVLDGAAGTPLAGVPIRVSEDGFGDGAGTGAADGPSTTTGADGRFSLSVTTDLFFAVVVDPVADFVGGAVREDGTVSWNMWDALWIDPANGGIVDLGSVVLTRGTEIGGVFSTPSFDGSARAGVSIASPDGEARWIDAPLVDGHGSWTARVVPGTYTVTVQSPDLGVETTFDVVVGAAAQTALDVELAVTARTIAGTVRGTGGVPAPGVDVWLSPVDPGGGPYLGRGTRTTTDGSYVLGNVEPGAYRVQFSSVGTPAVFWDGRSSWEDADILVVTERETTVTGIDATTVAGGTISGRALDRTGAPLVNAQVELYRDGALATITSTREDGTYTAEPLAPGFYTVALVQWRPNGTSLTQYYDGVADPDAATVVEVTEGATVGAIDFVALAGGVIAGTVTLAGGEPVEGARVEVYAASDQYMVLASTETGADGSYELSGLATQNYAVRVSQGSAGVVPRWFGEDGTREGATAIALAEGETVEVDVVVERGGAIRGTVTFPSGATEPAWVNALSLDGSIMDMGVSVAVYPPTDGSMASWEATGLTAGPWQVSVQYDGRFVYYPDAPSWEDAVPVEVTVGTTVDGIDFDLVGDSDISGTILDHAGAPAVGADVYVGTITEWGFSVVGSTRTGTDGSFALGDVAPGDYVLRVYAASQGLAERLLERDVTVGEQPVHVDLRTEPGLEVSGVVRDATTGAALPYAEVTLSADYPESAQHAISDAFGRFVLRSPTSGAHSLVAVSEHYVRSETTIDVLESGTTSVDLILATGTTVRGRVVAANNGLPLSGVTIGLQRPDGTQVGWGYTAPDGRYTIDGVAAGDYLVEFRNDNGLYVSQWYDQAAERSAASVVPVGTTAVAGVDARLTLGAVVSGVALDQTGAPVAYARVGLVPWPVAEATARSAAGALADGAWDFSVQTWTNELGQYTLPAVEPGRYALYVYVDGEGTTWYDGQAELVAADPIQLSAGNAPRTNLTLRARGEGEEPRTPEQSVSSELAVVVQPADVSVVEGDFAELSAHASGPRPPAVQWQVRRGADWVDVDGAQATSLQVSTSGSEGDYADGDEFRAVFTLDDARVVSEVARLSVTPRPEAPARVEGVATREVGATRATVTWEAPSGNGAVTGYVVRLYAGDTTTPVRVSHTPAVTELLLSGLAPETEYRVSVAASNAAGTGDESEAASFVTSKAPTPAPAPPTAVKAVAGDGRATVTWTAPGGVPVASYRVVAAPGGHSATTNGATSAEVTGLSNGTAYTFTVVAVGADGQESPPSTKSAAVTPGAPAPDPGTVSRWRGADRYATSAAISAQMFDPGVETVFVASGLQFPDALSGAPAAGVAGGPVLLVAPGQVPAAVASELERLDPKDVVVLGGSGAVSDAVLAQLEQYVG